MWTTVGCPSLLPCPSRSLARLPFFLLYVCFVFVFRVFGTKKRPMRRCLGNHGLCVARSELVLPPSEPLMFDCRSADGELDIRCARAFQAGGEPIYLISARGSTLIICANAFEPSPPHARLKPRISDTFKYSFLQTHDLNDGFAETVPPRASSSPSREGAKREKCKTIYLL